MKARKPIYRRITLYQQIAFAALVLAILITVAFSSNIHPVSASGSPCASGAVPITGYAWSDEIGWINLSCTTGGSGGTNICGVNPYGLCVDSSGNISGYGWSDSIGWVSANSADTSGCPGGTACQAKIGTSGIVVGWLKALSAVSGGWSGWISLADPSGSGLYGITLGSGGYFNPCKVGTTSCAWGEVNLGWVDFSDASTTYTSVSSCTCQGQAIYNNGVYSGITCTPPANFCSTGSCACVPSVPTCNDPGTGTKECLQVLPVLIQTDRTVQVFWNVSNVTGCTVLGTNGDSWTGDSSPSSGETSSLIKQTTIYKLHCPGYNGSPINDTKTVNVAPTFCEKGAPGCTQ
jgi:hypothetical protein